MRDSWKGFNLFEIRAEQESGTWATLQRFLDVDDPRNLGNGRDVKQNVGKYDQLRLACAWRIQNPALWARYEAGKDKIRRDLQNVASARKGLGKRPPGWPMRLHGRASDLPGPALDGEVRETMLMHGTKPQFFTRQCATDDGLDAATRAIWKWKVALALSALRVLLMFALPVAQRSR